MTNPLHELRQAREEARKAKDKLAEVVYITTISADGYPATRPVFSREITGDGVCLYLSELSPKFRELTANPKMTLTFHWPDIGRVFRVTGDASVIDNPAMESYWSSRHPTAQALAHFYEHVQQQSTAMASRDVLTNGIEKTKATLEKKGKAPLPKTWHCVLVKPHTVEAWTSGGDSRLHHRELYRRSGKDWKKSLLVP
ncbi:MAG: pyridoxamine 5'-phosphate oxidase family protein [Planctomycetaceae bacterium]|nr:pyridoxamine 5'-phosphate oxidase family protein [Planctomycetaceae bacterium]